MPKPFVNGDPRAGRPRGARNRFSREFIEKLHADFQEHGESVIKVVRLEDPATYLKVCASLLPKELTVEAVADLGDNEVDAMIERLRTELLVDHKVEPARLEFRAAKDYSRVD